MRLPFLLTVPINAMIATVVRTNPEARQLLAESDGGLIAIELQDPSVSIRLGVMANGVELQSDYSAEPDLLLSGNVQALMAMADAGHDPILDGRVTATGDMSLAKLLQQLLLVLSVDWEAQLAPFIGDAAAHKLGTAVRGFSTWVSKTRERGTEDVGEYLQEESGTLVTRVEWGGLERGVDALREQLDRLSARIDRVQK